MNDLPSYLVPGIGGLVFDMRRQKNWRLVWDVEPPGFACIEKLLVENLLAEGEEFVHRDALQGRFGDRNLAGQYQAERLLARQELIPADLRDCYLVFLGTLWKGPDGRFYIPYLAYDTSQQVWTLEFHWSELIGWRGKGRLVTISEV